MTTAKQDRVVGGGSGLKPASIPTANIDFLRGIAATYVVINHTRGNLFIGGEAILAEADVTLFDKLGLAALQLTALGTEFVVLFFVLSGFAMAHSVSETRSRSRFYLKRIIRVWPAYLAALAFAAIVCVAVTVLGTQHRLGQGCVEDLCNASRLAEIAVYVDVRTSLTQQFWSLPYEILFYAISPFILISKRFVVVAFFGSLFGTVLSFILFGLKFNPSGFLQNFLMQEMLLFSTGAMAYHFFNFIPTFSWKRASIILIVSFSLALIIKKIVGETNLIGNIVFSVATVILIKNLPDRFGFSKVNFGYFSYSIYIYHVAIIGLMVALLQVVELDRVIMSSYWGWILTLPVTIGFCWILWWCSERPCIAVLDRIRRRQRADIERTG